MYACSGTSIKERGHTVVPNQWDVGSKTRDTLVDILKGLQIRQLYHHEKRLLEGVGDGGSFLQQEDYFITERKSTV